MAENEDQAKKLEQVVGEDLNAASTPDGKIDIEVLRKRNAPLASVIDEFVMSKTARDVVEPIKFDVIDAMNKHQQGGGTSSLDKALSDLDTKISEES